MLNNSIFYVILYLFFNITFYQFYKISLKNVKNEGALTIVLELLMGSTCLFIIPFFEIKFPSNFSVYIFLLLACIFYAIYDRLGTTVLSGLEASTFTIINQLSTVFMIIAGVLFFKEPFIWNKILGAFLIIVSNIMVFYNRKIKLNKYVLLGVLANLFFTVALFIDVNFSNEFNLPLYVSITVIIPAIFILIFDKVKIKDLVEEVKTGDKKAMIITSICWAFMIINLLRAYQLGEVTVVAPLVSLNVMLNVIVSYFILGEKDNLLKKIIASILIIIGIILIKV